IGIRGGQLLTIGSAGDTPWNVSRQVWSGHGCDARQVSVPGDVSPQLWNPRPSGNALQRPASRDVPQKRDVTATLVKRHAQRPAVGREARIRKPSSLPTFEPVYQSGRVRPPEVHRPIDAFAGEHPAIRREEYRCHAPLVAFEHRLESAGPGVPQPDGTVRARRGEPIAVPCERERSYCVLMSGPDPD